MPLSVGDRVFLKGLYQKLDVWPLEAGDPLYQPVYEHEGCEDPISILQNRIEFAEVQSLTLFSGFQGSGKTTELFRLRKRLQESGYIVLYADALEYLNRNLPIDITDLLIVLAGAFSDALCTLNIDLKHEGYWTRLWNWLSRTEVGVKELGLKSEVSLDPVKAGADLKLEFKNAPTFRQRLSEALIGRIGELRREVVAFFEDGVKAIEKANGEDAKLVFLFDSLEQLRGSLWNEAEVIRSVEGLFANHLKLLEIPYVHMVYTVPPWLKFALQGAQVDLLPCVRLWNNDAERSACPGGMAAFRGVLKRRFAEEGLVRFFGEQPFARADELIRLSGGHFRDLLLLLRETIVRTQSLPVLDEPIRNAVLRVRSNFLPIALDEARWLSQIEQGRGTSMQKRESGDIALLSRFLNSHIVLYLKNGEEWYDVHPLVRDEVWEIIRSADKVL